MSSPGLSWDAMLKMTKINLDLISDIDMQLVIEKVLRGGISYIAHRHAKANNKYMGDYNPQKESRKIKNVHGNSSGNVKKLVPTLLKKTNYDLHCKR